MLSPSGLARAQALVHAVEKLGISAIYESDTNRAHETVAPLAAVLGLTPIVYPAADTSAVAGEVLAQPPGATILVVGHSNTVPQIIAAMGGPSLPNIVEQEFDNLFLLTSNPSCPDTDRLAQLQYGDVSP